MAEQQSLAQRFKIPAPTKIDFNQAIVLVEDQQEMRLIISHHLNKLGFKKVLQAGNGYDAIEVILESDSPIALIISDSEMPVMGGIDLLQELREKPEVDRPPFILTMDNPDKEKIMFALENGADEIIVKPFTFNDILPKIQSGFAKFHNPRNPEKVYELAKKLYRNDKLEEAKKVYELIGAENKKSARPWVGVARVYRKQGKMQDALKALEEAEKRNPHFVHLFAERGRIYTDANKSESAVLAFKRAIELSPLNPTRYEDAAHPLFKEKKFQEGVEILSVALTHELNFPSLHHYLSEGFYALKDFKKAIFHIRKALSDEPENVKYLNQLGISLKESGEFDEALKTYNSIIKIDNDNKAAYYNKAILLHAQNQLDEAIKLLERAVKKFPDFQPAQAKLAEFQAHKATPAA